MILSAQSIRARCLERMPPLLTPFVERSVSLGGRSFGLSAASYDVRIDQDMIIPPHVERDMVADAIVEHIKLCNWTVERGPPWEGFAYLGRSESK
jgi:hypothetical protein